MTKIAESISQILNTADLTPRPAVNDAFSYLVENRMKIVITDLSAETIEKMQKASSTAEYLLEKHWAEKIIKKEAKLDDFIYLDYYKALVAKEVEELTKVIGKSPKSVSFIGGGPSPLTSILMAKDFGIKSVVYDSDETACNLAKKVIDIENLTEFIKVINKKGEHAELSSDVLFVAALAEDENGKNSLFEYLYNKIDEGVPLAVRGSEGASELFYKPLSENILSKYKEVGRVSGDEFINTTHIFLK